MTGKHSAGEKDGKTAKKTPHYHGHRERLRRRVLDGDDASLADYELLEILLCAVIPRRDVKPIAKELLARTGGLSALLASPPRRLMETDGVGRAGAACLRTVHLLSLRASLNEIKGRPVISSWAALVSYVRRSLQHESAEQFRVLFLDRKNRIICDEVMGRGTIDHAPVYPRELARRALEVAASSVILVHNHPSGDPSPSQADISMTREIVDSLSSLDIEVHDHLVVGRDGMASFKTQRLL